MSVLSLVQKSPTECDVCVCDREVSKMRRPCLAHWGVVAPWRGGMWEYEVTSAKTEVFHVTELSCDNGKIYPTLMCFTMVRIARRQI